MTDITPIYRRPSRPSPTRKTTASSSLKETFNLPTAESISHPQPPEPLSPLLASTIINTGTNLTSDISLKQGEITLSALETLRHDVALGRIDVTHLQDIASTVQHQQLNTNDPHLKEILQEIETRALVELAKRGLAQKGQVI